MNKLRSKRLSALLKATLLQVLIESGSKGACLATGNTTSYPSPGLLPARSPAPSPFGHEWRLLWRNVFLLYNSYRARRPSIPFPPSLLRPVLTL